MPALVQQIANEVQFDLLEDVGFILGLITPTQFTNILNLTIREFCKETGIAQAIFTESVAAGVSRYPVPSPIMRPDDCFLAGVYLEQSDIATLDRYHPQWRFLIDYPTNWHNDAIPTQNLELVPVPNYSGSFIRGANFPDPPNGQFGSFSAIVETSPGVFEPVPPDVTGALTIIGPQESTDVAAYTDQVPLIPTDLALTYLSFGCLSRIFGTDSELVDPGRAEFCHQIWQEGLMLMKSYFGEPGD